MDAVELPLPANVVVSKLLGSDDFARVGETESRDSAGVSGCSPYRRDTKNPVVISECSSASRSKKTDADLCPSVECEENVKRHDSEGVDRPILLLPKNEGKLLNRKSLKKLAKRSRTDKTGDPTVAAEANDRDAKKIGYDNIRCTTDEKSRMVKHKRAQDGKRIDKKNIRASVRTKYDPFTSKTGFVTSDSVSGGNDILGIYGLKSDLHDVTKHVEELSLDELLDGSYKYPNVCPEKTKKASNSNENLLLSIRKACSVLPLCGGTDSGGSRKAVSSLLNPSFCSTNISDCDDKDKWTDEMADKVPDPCQANTAESALLQPKDLLEQLSLPLSQDLDSLMLNSNMNSVPSQSTVHMKNSGCASLPPFTWSFSHSGVSKPVVDSGKLALTKHACQGRWVRIGSKSTSSGDDNNSSSGLDLMILHQIGDPANQPKLDGLLQDVKVLCEAHKPPFDGQFSTSGARIRDINNSKKGSDTSGSLNFRKLKQPGKHAKSLDGQLECDSKDYAFLQTSESEGGLRCLKDDSSSVDPSKFVLGPKGGEVSQDKQLARTVDCSGNCCNFSCKCSSGGRSESLWHLPTPETARAGLSPRRLAAATILYEMANSSSGVRAQQDTTGRIKWPKAPSQKTMKARKPVSPVEKIDRLFLGSRHYDSVKQSGLTSVKPKMVSEKKTDFTHPSNAGREPVRWSFTADVGGVSPVKAERDRTTASQWRTESNSVRPMGLMPSPTRIEKVYDNQQKLRKATLKSSSVAFGGTYIKDWNRGRSKRV